MMKLTTHELEILIELINCEVDSNNCSTYSLETLTNLLSKLTVEYCKVKILND